jgi:hypothetical protein
VVHNVSDPFHNRAVVSINREAEVKLPTGMSIKPISENTVELGLNRETATLDAADVDDLISALVMARTKLWPEVPMGFGGTPEQARSYLATIDPVWRAERDVHPDFPGAHLRLRHPGHGWVLFILPVAEALNLGKWLVSYAESRAQG